MFRPTIYKRPHVYKSNAYQRYGVNAGGVGVYKLPYGTPQEWTKNNVPTGVQTLHDFGDGAGPVPAIPLDSAGVYNEITNVNCYVLNKENCGVSNEIIDITEVL